MAEPMSRVRALLSRTSYDEEPDAREYMRARVLSRIEETAAGGSMGGQDPRAHGRIRYIVRSFGTWAQGKHSICTKRLQAEHPEICRGNCAALCFAPGTLIQTERGLVAIEELVPGEDRVRTHLGRYMPVEGVVCSDRAYQGELVTFRTSLCSEGFTVTADHEVLVCRGVPFREGSRQRDHRVAARAEVGLKGRHHWHPGMVVERHGATIEMVRAGDVRASDFLVYPTDREVVDREEIHDDVLRLIGWYAAEGTLVRGTTRRRSFVIFSLGPGDESIERDIVAICERTFGVTPGRYSGGSMGKGFNLIVRSPELAQVLEEAVGCGAATKRFAPWVMALPTERLALVLDAYWEGDGHVRPRRDERVASTVSRDLAFQLRDILIWLGHVPSVTRSTWHQDHPGPRRVGDRVSDIQNAKLAWTVRYTESGSRLAPRLNGFLLLPIREIRKEVMPNSSQASVPVYDLQVAEDHTVVLTCGSAHNCAWLKLPTDQWAGTTKWRGPSRNPRQKAEDLAIERAAKASARLRFAEGDIDALYRIARREGPPLEAVLSEAILDARERGRVIPREAVEIREWAQAGMCAEGELLAALGMVDYDLGGAGG